MCIAFLAYQHFDDFPLVLAANRDEFYNRPAKAMTVWSDRPNLLAGRDLQAGGTWLALSSIGRLAFLTNYRQVENRLFYAPSRGNLVLDFVDSERTIEEYQDVLEKNGHLFNGFNLIFGNTDKLCYYSNRDIGSAGILQPGIYGLSNHLLDKPWPKVVLGKRLFKEMDTTQFDVEALFSILANESRPPDDQLPDTGIGIEMERLLSSIYIRSDTYGSRCGTVVCMKNDGMIQVEERTYKSEPSQYDTRIYARYPNRSGWLLLKGLPLK